MLERYLQHEKAGRWHSHRRKKPSIQKLKLDHQNTQLRLLYVEEERRGFCRRVYPKLGSFCEKPFFFIIIWLGYAVDRNLQILLAKNT